MRRQRFRSKNLVIAHLYLLWTKSLDFDESSLMTLDESLLDSGSKGIRLDDEPIDLHDDMLLDTRADEFDDILMNDDDLLDSKDLLDASSMDDELIDDLLD